MSYVQKDFYYKEAKKNQFAARSIFKLEEIDRKYRILAQGQRVLDLGAAPGSWSQYASSKIGQRGLCVGIDLQPVALTLPNAVFLQADLLRDDVESLLKPLGLGGLFDVVLSDMAPKTTGIRITDQARSLELCEMALSIAEKCLKPGSAFICKLFESQDAIGFRARLKERFGSVELLRPQSTRKESKEIYLICRRFV